MHPRFAGGHTKCAEQCAALLAHIRRLGKLAHARLLLFFAGARMAEDVEWAWFSLSL